MYGFSVDSLLEDRSKEHNNLLGINLLSDWERTKQQITEDTGLSFGVVGEADDAFLRLPEVTAGPVERHGGAGGEVGVAAGDG